MAPDRDLNVAVASALAPLGRGWEMMAATGVRGLRVGHESGALTSLLQTDRGAEAVSVLARNAARASGPPVGVARHDARQPPALAAFDLVDLDPYGSPTPFLESALDALRVPGWLAVTATDMRVLAGVERGVAEARYGGVPIRGRFGPEGGLRLLLAYVIRAAARRSLRARPLLAYVRDHHVRAYLRVEAADPAPGLAAVARIDPSEWAGPRLPAGGPYGPLWTGALFEPSLATALVPPPTAADGPGVTRLIERFRGEAAADRPFFYESNVLAHEEHLAAPLPPDRIIRALRDHGWPTARTHAREGAFRTAAPRPEVVRLLSEAAG